ncbi:MAG TPA: 4Fe-4S single cluster domain-containing protein, partial [Pyrinomonadaceae bacterium]|nr:4Fe-4S single cluster domain-containing protein [Pyrinomonadaceae bacterium]
MPEITFIVDDLRGAILVEDNPDLSRDAIEHLREHLGESQEIGCARPLEIIEPIADSSENGLENLSVRIAGYYHDSLTEGPGRRSSVLFQFCPLKCKGCWTPQLHSKEAGELISVEKLAELLLDPEYERDGVTILGGEPFAQPEGLNALIKRLRSKNCPHIVCYTGYTLEVLREKAVKQPAIGEALNQIDVLIDGAYVESLSSGAGLWTGSGNQRVIDLRATIEI